MKSITEICLRKFRVRRSLQKNEIKNKKGNDQKKKKKNKEKKNKKSKKKVKGKEKNTSKGKKKKNLKNKPIAENNSKKCKVKKRESTKKVRSKRADQDPDQNPCRVTLFKEIPEFDAILEEIKSCVFTPASGINRFYIYDFA